MRDFRNVHVWGKAHALTLAVYRATGSFPTEERYGLTSQLRRCSVSIGGQLAEGCGRGSPAELAQFLRIAMGSASEVEYELLLARDLQFLSAVKYEPLNHSVVEVERMLASFLHTVAEQRAAAH